MQLDVSVTNAQVSFNGYGDAKVSGASHGQSSHGVSDDGKYCYIEITFVPVKKRTSTLVFWSFIDMSKLTQRHFVS